MATVDIVEVGARDGLQNEPSILPVAQKLELIRRLENCGLRRIEATACVSARAVPQMADYESVLAGLPTKTGAVFGALVANMRGLEAALKSNAGEIAVFTAASDSFTRKNINCSVAESLARFAPIIKEAKSAGRRVRGYVSTAVVCPYEGAVPPGKAAAVAASLANLGCDEISLGDTIGAATPQSVRALLQEVRGLPALLAVHFHDTYGCALANIACALEENIRIIDSSVAGLGGCPFAPGAAGNLATEDAVYFLEKEGFDTGLDLDMLISTGEWICKLLSRSYTAKAGIARRAILNLKAK